jgi:hypothetical protein
MLTYSEITMYAVFSFKNYFKMQIHSAEFKPNSMNFFLSFVVIAYYFGYLLRMLIGSFVFYQNRLSKSSLKVLFHMFPKGVLPRLSKMFLPLLIFRNTCIALFISLLSENPFHQSVSCLAIIIFSLILNLCICPY